jgi:capsular polysaccharide biosynthesis protein
MALQPGSEYFDLSDYVGVLRRRWALIVALTLIGLVLGGVYYYLTPKKYAATVLVQVNALPSNANQLGGRTGGPVNMDNEAQIVVSAEVTAIVKSKLKSPLGVTALAKQVHVAVPPNTTYLQITCTTGSADLAQRCANDYGKAYLYNRRTSSLALISSEIKSLDTEVTQLEDSISKLKAQTGKGGFPPGSRRYGLAKLNLTAEITKLGSIESKVTAVTPFATSLAVANSPLVGQVVTPAITPFAAISPKKKLDLPSGLAAGLVIGLATAYLLDWRRPRLHTARDVQRKVDLPNIFSLADGRAGGTQSGLVSPRSPSGQTFTELARYVGAALGDGHHVVMVTAASPGGSWGSSARTSPATDGGGTVAVNLAAALARTRGETILICADPRGVIPRLLGNSDGRGFAELLAGTASLADVAREAADVPMLEVITPGLDAASAVYDMRYDKVQRIMRDLRREVRYVVIDVPSPGIDADTFSVAEFADAAILTLPAGTARVADINDCLQRLERLRTAVLAAVLVPAAGKAGRRGRRPQPPVDQPYVRDPIARQPIDRQPADRQPADRQPADRHPVDRLSIDREPPIREAHSRLPQPDAEPAAPSPRAYSSPAPAPPVRAAEVRPAEPRHPDARYAEPLYTDPLSSDPRSDVRTSSDPRPTDPHRTDLRTTPDPRPTDPRPADARRSDVRTGADPRPADPRRAEPRHGDPRLSEPRLSEPRLSEPRLSEPRLSEPRLSEPGAPEVRPAESRTTEARPTPSFKPTPPTKPTPSTKPIPSTKPTPSFKPHPRTPVVQPVTRDESSTPGPSAPSAPVLRPVAGRRPSAQGGTNGGGSRHATPAHAEESGQSAGSLGAWRPRNVNETWPLPANGLTDDDEESGPADPPSGKLHGRYDRP